MSKTNGRAKKRGNGQKNSGKEVRKAGTDRGSTGTDRGSTGTDLGNTGIDLGNTGIDLGNTGTEGLPEPQVARVELVAPARTGRRVEDLAALRRNARVRLILAWMHQEELGLALPTEPPFHAHAWTALQMLDDAPFEAGAVTPEKALTTLHEELLNLRAIVGRITRPGDPPRAALLFGQELRPTYDLVEVGATIVAGAREIQGEFPALTNAVLADAEMALERAKEAVRVASGASLKRSVLRTDSADQRQLALDVLLNSLDLLAAAAIAMFRKSRPKLAEALSAPIEPGRRNGREVTEEPTPEPAPEPQPAPSPA